MSRANDDRTLDVKTITSFGVLIAIQIVLARFLSIQAWNLRIGFSFIPIAVAGMLYGPLGGGIVGAVGDFLGAILFPTGSFFPGFTLNAFLTGCIFGIFLHRKKTHARVAGAVAVNQLLLSLFLQSLWISILYGSPYSGIVATRVFQCAIMIPTQFVILTALSHPMDAVFKRVGLAAK